MTKTMVLILGLAAAVRTVAAQERDAERRYQEAWFEETANGDLETASGIYRSILDDGGAIPSRAAEAGWRLAACLEALDRTVEARTVLERVVREFPAEPAGLRARAKLEGAEAPPVAELLRIQLLDSSATDEGPRARGSERVWQLPAGGRRFYSRDDLVRRFSEWRGDWRPGAVSIEADPGVSYERVALVLEACRALGMSGIEFGAPADGRFAARPIEFRLDGPGGEPGPIEREVQTLAVLAGRLAAHGYEPGRLPSDVSDPLAQRQIEILGRRFRQDLLEIEPELRALGFDLIVEGLRHLFDGSDESRDRLERSALEHVDRLWKLARQALETLYFRPLMARSTYEVALPIPEEDRSFVLWLLEARGGVELLPLAEEGADRATREVRTAGGERLLLSADEACPIGPFQAARVVEGALEYELGEDAARGLTESTSRLSGRRVAVLVDGELVAEFRLAGAMEARGRIPLTLDDRRARALPDILTGEDPSLAVKVRRE